MIASFVIGTHQNFPGRQTDPEHKTGLTLHQNGDQPALWHIFHQLHFGGGVDLQLEAGNLGEKIGPAMDPA